MQTKKRQRNKAAGYERKIRESRRKSYSPLYLYYYDRKREREGDVLDEERLL